MVGFGAVCMSRWNWPQPNGAKTNVVLIPMLGLAEQFRGQPPDPEWRYSLQIMGHLLGTAEQIAQDWPDPTTAPRNLVLLVHRDNTRAIRLYERCGFELIEGVERKHGNRVMHVRIGE